MPLTAIRTSENGTGTEYGTATSATGTSGHRTSGSDASMLDHSFQSWGRYPKYAAHVVPMHWQQDFPANIDGLHNGVLPVGMGRSYGDSCLLRDGNLVVTTGMNRLLDFDPETGILTAEAGASLAEILDFAPPARIFPARHPRHQIRGPSAAPSPTTSTARTTNVAGTFGCHVLDFELVLSDGSRRLCSRTENPDWFGATIGGLGLTGLITWVRFRLRRIVSRMIDYEGIQFHGIDEFLALCELYKHVEYTVSWIDCAATGRNFARGIFMLGEHATVPGELKPSPDPRLFFPIDAPGCSR